ncbi:pre-mRNA-splicing factor syf2 [Monascus purpureus]|uniref:Pre-mRNA-splicing factor SYF2 n=1 Tax=Monascus purpureus TaxID=5098 RepID=A0A507R0J6_MONPU|nr:pre-mRNA-splicing factor syf2 [Monascus purpureus]BDD58031.1 pre-mRNA-splicing factor syf2 [Monascus purpureus]
MPSPQKSKEPTVDSTGSHDSGDNNNSPKPEDQQARKVDGSVDSTEEPKHGESSTGTTSESKEDDAVAKARARQERFKALQARAKNASKRNLKETAAETQRLATDPALMSTLSRKHAFASHNLLKADTEAAGEDFERKRAWDWTIDESEKWDKRMEKKQRHRDDVAFQDYTQDARKVYKRQLREMKPDMEAYEREKMAAIEKAAANGDLEIVETNDGEMIAVDKNGTFYSTADTVGFTENKPDRAAVDKLVADLRKAEEVRLKKRKERRSEEDPDVTYINEKNKQFNQKLARFYNKYTTEIRDSFERGTMI